MQEVIFEALEIDELCFRGLWLSRKFSVVYFIWLIDFLLITMNFNRLYTVKILIICVVLRDLCITRRTDSATGLPFLVAPEDSFTS